MSSPSITHASPSLKSSTSTLLSSKFIQWCTKLVENFYKEPPDDGCVGSFIETPVASIDFNIPSTSKGQSNDSKVKNQQKHKEKKDNVKKDIRSFLGGSSIVKSSGPLNSKEKKIVQIDSRKLNVYFLKIFNCLHCLG